MKNDLYAPALPEFRDAALAAFVTKHIKDPHEMATAYYVDSRKGYYTDYNQLVTLPGYYTAVVRQVHYVIPHFLEPAFDASLEETESTYSKVGQTRAYGSTLGVHALGVQMKHDLEKICASLKQHHVFLQYMRNYFDTREGYIEMRGLNKQVHGEMSDEDYYALVCNSHYPSWKEGYVYDFLSLPVDERKDIIERHSDNLRQLFAPQSPDDVQKMYEDYLNVSPSQDEELYAEKVRRQRNGGNMFQGIHIIR